MAFLSLQNITFSYKDNPVIKDFSLEVEKGSFTTLLGSSGCGKTTLLNLITGFLEPQEGKITINDKLMNNVLPNKRKIGMVFQNYALFPHMTVKQNLLYGLNLSETKNDRKKNIETVLEMAQILGIEELLERYPSELSGGQKQRVSLGRALVLKPDVLLMDEPLSSLDTRLRKKVREELKEIQKKFGITTIYVTHDQEEALSLSDKIAVINDGTLYQYASPEEIYFNPLNKFTADFVGSANFLFEKNGSSVQEIMVRPEWIEITEENDACDYKGKIISKEFLGSAIRIKIALENSSLNENNVIVCDADPLMDFSFCENAACGVRIRRKCVIEEK